jgi:hypothetical protein
MVDEEMLENTVVVAEMVEIPAKREVEEAEIPAVKRMRVEVELAAVAKLEAPGVNQLPTESVAGVT